MASDTLSVSRGANDKPVATEALIDDLRMLGVEGRLMTGYPVIASPEGSVAIDALLVSPKLGIVSFALVQGLEPGDFITQQDESFNLLRSRLLRHRELRDRRDLKVPIEAVTYAPAISHPPDEPDRLLNRDTIAAWVQTYAEELTAAGFTSELYERALSALDNISNLRRMGKRRHTQIPDSKGAKLLQLEGSIATLDKQQSKAVIETAEGVQRIRGLAGSGKTIVLALKAAYLHARYPEWRMAVTFNTRSLKPFYTSLINTFVIEQTGAEPDWENVRILNAWGASGSPERDGIYYEFCRANNAEYHNFSSAKRTYGWEEAFNGAVTSALKKAANPRGLYDVLLIDEAQDLPSSFLRLCFKSLKNNGRLVYAYDELQNLTNVGLPPAEEIFGISDGKPLVRFDRSVSKNEAQRDIILEKCYRNSRPVLVTAHALGFGIYRNPYNDRLAGRKNSGLVQMFDEPGLWKDIGYRNTGQDIAPGAQVKLLRSSDSSPTFLEDHSPLNDLIKFKTFDTQDVQAKWVAKQIKKNLDHDELRPDDIMVINTDPLAARSKLALIRATLADHNIQSHLAGVDTNPDEFFQHDSITCSGVHRAKGNEAAMVYVVNADECEANSRNLSSLRNRLFTAITRSKSWVRVTGIGIKMEALVKEFNELKRADFQLEFQYPTRAELDELRIIHRDMTAADQRALEDRKTSVSRLIHDLQEGTLYIEDFDPDQIEALRMILSEQMSQP